MFTPIDLVPVPLPLPRSLFNPLLVAPGSLVLVSKVKPLRAASRPALPRFLAAVKASLITFTDFFINPGISLLPRDLNTFLRLVPKFLSLSPNLILDNKFLPLVRRVGNSFATAAIVNPNNLNPCVIPPKVLPNPLNPSSSFLVRSIKANAPTPRRMLVRKLKIPNLFPASLALLPKKPSAPLPLSDFSSLSFFFCFSFDFLTSSEALFCPSVFF